MFWCTCSCSVRFVQVLVPSEANDASEPDSSHSNVTGEDTSATPRRLIYVTSLVWSEDGSVAFSWLPMTY
uniref:Uncharacterized protein n=1 Tax=Arundo donax TaxID=35708 RepID=A0A0A9H0Q8_ARUDO